MNKDTGTSIAVYVYPGWHACAEREKRLGPGFSEWDLVFGAPARFPGHDQPRVPAAGPYDDALPETAARQIGLAVAYGVDAFVYGFFWSRGKRVFGAPLDDAFLGCCGDFPFALMWANRMPRGVMPVKLDGGPEIDPTRLVYTDPDDFLALIEYAAERYFRRPNYLKIDGRIVFAIFDSAFFLRQMGVECARAAVERAREYLAAQGLPELKLIAVNPAPAFEGLYARAGFDAVTHYVFLPDWKGAYRQDYDAAMRLRSDEWGGFAARTGLEYYPSVSPGWDATPRGAEACPDPPPKKYPWWPVVTDGRPELFEKYLGAAIRHSRGVNRSGLVFVASWNEWSEGHYLEPDTKFGAGWLAAVQRACRDA